MELLLCLLLWGALAGAVLLTMGPVIFGEGGGGGPVSPRTAIWEGEKITRWLQRTLVKACIERRSFELRYYSGRRDFIRLQWYSPPETEVYFTNGRCWVEFDSKGKITPRYSPAWHTMTPAVTLKVLNDGGKYGGRVVGKITISGYCLVSFREVE